MGTDYDETIVKPGDRLSKLWHQVNTASRDNCPALTVLTPENERFRGGLSWRWQRAVLEAMLRGELAETTQADGLGSKGAFYTHCPAQFHLLAHDLIAMMADDISATGGLPTHTSTVLDVKRITEENYPHAEALVLGAGKAMKQAGLVSFTGETAVIPTAVTAFCDTGDKEQLVLLWSGTCIGLTHRDADITGMGIRPNMAIIGLHEESYRCNGGSRLGDLLNERWPDQKVRESDNEAQEFLKLIAQPSTSYARALARLNGWRPDGSWHEPPVQFEAVHVTGGGILGKLGDVLPEDTAARFPHMPEPTRVLWEAQRISRRSSTLITDHECHTTFNGGIGMLLLCAMEDADTLLSRVRHEGIAASVVGNTAPRRAGEPAITILSRFFQKAEVTSEEQE